MPTFKSAISRQEKSDARLDIGGMDRIDVAAPPEYGGREGVATPESLLLGAVNSCLMLAFYYAAGLKKTDVLTYEGEAEGTVEKSVEKRRLWFSRITVRARVKLANPEEVGRLAELRELAEKFCIVSASLQSPVEYVVEPTS